MDYGTIYAIANRGDAAGELAYQLRGGAIFDMHIAEGARDIRAPKPGHAGIDLPIRSAVHRGIVAFADLTCMIDNHRLQEWCLNPIFALVIDVHFPFADPELIRAIVPGRRDVDDVEAVDVEATEFWLDPDRRANAIDLLDSADAITCPREDWAAGLRTLTETKVYVLPDVSSPTRGAQFVIAMNEVAEAARWNLFFESQPWPMRVYGRILRGVLGRGRKKIWAQAAQETARKLRESGIDWQARREGVR